MGGCCSAAGRLRALTLTGGSLVGSGRGGAPFVVAVGLHLGHVFVENVSEAAPGLFRDRDGGAVVALDLEPIKIYIIIMK